MRGLKIIVDSGIIAGHLTSKGSQPSALRLLMKRFFCYTTVFNAVELFALCSSDREYNAVENVLQSMKVLGLNAKSGKAIGLSFGAHRQSSPMNLLIAGLCRESRLPLVTDREKAFRGMTGLDVRNVSQVLKSKE